MSDGASIDTRRRRRVFEALEQEDFDLVVIGGGITGAGIARDAAMRGLSVALVEARDFASGTSSRSSKLIHGGLRYLAQGNTALVKEAASERQVLRRIAPHLARVCPFLIPTSSIAGVAKMRAALWTFEKLGAVPADEKHEVIGTAELARREPLLRREGLNGAVVYPEFLTDDARLVLANARAAQAAGAKVLNHAEVVSFVRDQDRIAAVIVRSSLTGENLDACVRARRVVNAAGAWVDRVASLETSDMEARLSLSSGIHLVLDRARLPINAALILRTSDKRSIFAVPRGAFTYLGTTDVFYPLADYWPDITRADVDYILQATQAALDIAPIADGEIVAMWSGIRPLITQPGKKASEVSRKDEIWTSASGLISIAGGKLSAYRAMAERVVDKVVAELQSASKLCTTAQVPLPGGGTAPGAFGRMEGIEAVAAERLVGLYGDEAGEIVREGGDIAAEAARAVTHEGAAMLEDYWVRRSARAWFDHGAGLAALEPAAATMGALLDWSQAEQAAQIAICRAIEKGSRQVLDQPVQGATDR